MISGDALLFGSLLALVALFVAIAIVIGGVGLLLWSALDLARGNFDHSFLRSLKVFVLFSALTGLMVFYECTMDGMAIGLKSLVNGSKTFNSLVFWTPFVIQMLALVVLIPAWRKRRQDKD